MAQTDWGIGVVGLGGIAQHHLEGYRRQGLTVIGGMDVDAGRRDAAAEKWGISITDDAEALIARPEVRIVDITVPHLLELRQPIVELAAKHGKALFIQKPLMPYLAEAATFVRIAEEARVPLMVNQNSLFAPQSLLIEPFLRIEHRAGKPSDEATANWLGDPYYFQIENRAWFDPGNHPWVGKSQRWVNSDMAIHHYALARHWFGDAESVSAILKKDVSQPGAHGETCCCVTIRFKSGVSGLVLNNWSYRGPRFRSHPSEEMIIQGDRGSLTADTHEVAVEAIDGSKRLPVEGTWFPDAFGASMAHYVNALDKGEPFLCEGRDNLKTLAIVEAAYRSAAEGREVKVGEVLAEVGVTTE